MALESGNYFSNLATGMAQLLGGIVSERSIPLLRPSPQVQLSAPSSNSGNYHLSMTGRQLFEEDKGSFTSGSPAEGILVFRNPVRTRVSFSLVGGGLTRYQSVTAYDRLTTYFFDHRTVPPFLPASLNRYPALLDRMKGHKAELRIVEPAPTTAGFSFSFEYTALYHSGNPLREEQAVTQRVLELAKGKGLYEQSV